MKLLLVHNRYQTNKIGGEDIVYENELISLRKKLGEENVLCYEIANDNLSKFKLLFNIWFSFEHYENIKKVIKDNNIDIVHVHNFYPLITPSVFKAAKDSNCKVIHTLHNYRLWCISGIFFRNGYGICEKCIKNKFSIKGILNKCFRKSLIQSFVSQLSFWFYDLTKVFDTIDYFFVLTKFQKNKVISLGLNKNKVILKPNSLEINTINSNLQEGYIFVGRLEESKGVFDLLNVWKNLDSKFVLTIIGVGDLDNEIRKKYNKPNIIFKGKCSREDTLNLISKSKYMIQSSVLYETFGLTIIEAMSFGVPVIGFDIGTRGDFIEDSKNGFLSDRDNLKDIVIKSLGYKDYKMLSQNALITAKLYENDFIIEKQIEIYENILENKV